MKVYCSTDGLVEVAPGFDLRNVKNFKFNHFIAACPVCKKRITMKGHYDFDEEGTPSPSAFYEADKGTVSKRSFF